MNLSAGFIQQTIAQWSRYRSLLQDMGQSLRIRPAECHSLEYAPFQKHDLTVDVLRLDQIHPVVSGNKWFKLRYNLADALLQKASCLVTFGGAWSNHLHAFAFAGRHLGMRTVALVRGEEWATRNNPMLEDIRQWGTEVIAVPRHVYRNRHDRSARAELLQQFPGAYLIPEGGDNYLGLLGMATLGEHITGEAQRRLLQADDVWIACGTGNSFAGLRLALPAAVGVKGVAAVKGAWFRDMIASRLALNWPLTTAGWQINTAFHGGGFGKLPHDMKNFMLAFERDTGVMLDPVYTAKLCYGVVNLARQGCFHRGQRLVLIHTGGLQGRRSWEMD